MDTGTQAPRQAAEDQQRGCPGPESQAWHTLPVEEAAQALQADPGAA